MTAGSHILVVDDDKRVRNLLRRYFEKEGFRVTEASDGEDLRNAMARSKVDLVMLDVGLPGEDGLSIARHIRSTSDVPIIMVTGRGDTIDRVVGLELGADDYIAKPFQLREVLARVRSVMRRSGARTPTDRAGTASEPPGEAIKFNGWTLDFTKRELRAPTGSPVLLTSGEFNLLAIFAKNANRVLDRDRIMDLTRGHDWTPYDRSIDTQVGRLRKKIEGDPRNPELIKTVRGTGYVFAASVEKA